MTGQDVFERACAYLMESPGQDRAFSANALELINALIAEAVPYQNSRNRAAGRPEIETAAITALSDTIALDAPICECALPFGLASYFFQDEVDAYQAEIYRARFDEALRHARRLAEGDIRDVYGGDA